jgi:hypothetical protein
MTEPAGPGDLVQQGKAAARVGLNDEARDILRRAVDLRPDDVEAWLALAGVEEDPSAKIDCFQHVLELDPGHVEAKLSLEMLQPIQDRAPAPTDLPQPRSEMEQAISEASRQLEEALGPPPPDTLPLDDATLFCANHPHTETVLRCNRCSKPICTKCAVSTPVGYRCRECVGQQQAAYYSGGVADYIIGGLIAMVLGGVASVLMTMMGGAWFLSLILGPAIGIGIAELVRLAVRRRRSRYLWSVVAGGIIAGAVPALLLGLLGMNLWTLASLGIFLFLSVGAAVARLR